MPILYKTAWFLSAYFPSLLQILASRNEGMSINELLQETRSNYKLLPQQDQQIAARVDVEYLFCLSDMELLSRGQTQSLTYEYRLWGKDWGFDLSKITVPTCIWHGLLDISTTIAMGRYLSEKMSCSIKEVPNYGHFLYFDVFEEVLEWLSTVRDQEG